jgi:1-acyl-sn-glycerol-3-phosphate acyltransferase
MIMKPNFSTFFLRLLGWKITAVPPFPQQCVVIVVPHTSWIDFPLGLLTRASMKENIRYAGKSSLFKPPFGWIFKALGGYPVDRSKRSNLVDAIVDIYKKEPDFKLAIAPEGTRKQVTELKTGFYYIAKGAGVPIILCKFDYEHKNVDFSAPFYPTDDKDADFAFIYNYFRGVKGKKPSYSF